MKRPGRFERFLSGVALLVLAVGFTALGFLSFINNHPENVVIGLFSEAAYSIIGSSISIMVGATFLTAAVRFLETDLWQQYTKVGGIQDSEIPDGRGNPAYTEALEVREAHVGQSQPPVLSLASFRGDGSCINCVGYKALPAIAALQEVATELGPGYGHWAATDNDKEFRLTSYSVI